MKLDLNCDLGEGEPPSRTRALMQYVTSVNVACGVHAGAVTSMSRCVDMAGEFGVRIGAHPGLGGDFGRGKSNCTPAELELLLLHQVGALYRIAEARSARLHHVKLHGALYHAVERDPALARTYVKVLVRWFPRLCIYTLAGGRVVSLARNRGVSVWEEAFADRAYQDDGTLVPRTDPGAVLTDCFAVRERLLRLRSGKGILSISGRVLALKPRTVCVHGDTPKAVKLARTAAEVWL
ncbi:MAG TPA: 5-oxoprolinase subunit PxpA [Verrucomicrobiota bacterium]|nr:LamB/YcsF family protein [Verrucomicrobiales bacterium]HRI16130.1 5-oxoprolinase subunit PxpA [Verrucomicrobiota bacterium]